jgi:tetratricopeptide (TPR) repeat protein
LTSWKIGQMSVKLGSLTPAAPAAAPQPNPALAEIRAAVEARDFDRAGELAERALAGGLEHPAVLNLAALRCERQERFEDAVALLERALILAPDDVAAHNALGLCLSRLERYEEALGHFDRAGAAAPGFAGAHSARGAALESLGRLTAAGGAYQRAIALEPGNLGALAGLANLASRRGAHAEAPSPAIRTRKAPWRRPTWPRAMRRRRRPAWRR